ncbi:MAG: hypothetical protein IJZ93_01605 [Clostridia bacterium]|nr:hypothetical protein [Clostridia bacterium]
MSNNAKAKKLSFEIKLIILIAALAVVFLVLSIISAAHSVNRTVDAIDAIGTVEYTDASKEKIDLALSYYNELDTNIGLQERITNAEQLTNAKIEYVRLGIKKAYLADKNGEEEETVKQYVKDARASFDEYCKTGDCTNISNYADLVALEEKYGSGQTNASEGSSPSDSSGGSTDEEIELC